MLSLPSTVYGLPLHPIIVHVPLVVAGLLAVLTPLAAWSWNGGRVPKAVWAVVSVMLISVPLLGFVAMESGETEEERVEGRVPESAIEEHEERAEVFVWTGAGVALLGVGALVAAGPFRRTLLAATSLGALAVAGLGVATGHAGGELVYRHGAAARVEGAAASADAPNDSGAEGREDDEDEDESGEGR